MNFVFGIILGIVLGAVILYILGQRKLQAANQKLEQTRQALEESELLNRQSDAQVQELQAAQQVQVQELERRYQQTRQALEESELLNRQSDAQVQELQAAQQVQVQELERGYQDRIRQLQAEREAATEENRILAEQYENQIQQLTQALEEKQAITEDKIEGDLIAGIEAEYPEEIIGIDSLLDLLSDVEAEPEPPVTFAAPVQKVEQPAAVEKTDLAKEIITLGDSEDVTAIYQLTEYTYHPDSQIRTLAALSLGKIADTRSLRSEIRKLIPILGKLSRDSEPSVRQFAVVALGKIKSIKVIPFLKMAQRDTDSDVVKSASAALSPFKGYRITYKKKPLPKNARLIETYLQ